MTERLFGTDGIRAEAGTGPLTAERVVALGRCVVRVLRSDGIQGLDRVGRPLASNTAAAGTAARPSVPRVLLGRDPRGSGGGIACAMAAGMAAEGAEVFDGGILPTPAVALLTRRGGYDLGVVISASHNPAKYNGIKLFSATGFKVTDESERTVEAELIRGGPAAKGPQGCVERLADPHAEYISDALELAPRLNGWRIAVDCAHGAAYRLGPEILRRLGADVTAMGVRPDGRNINDGVGALHPEAVAALVKESGARVGMAFDGDADRVIFVDAAGVVRDGDHMLGLWGRYLAERGKLPNKVVVSTVMANFGLERALADKGIRLVRTAVGDRWVVEGLIAEGADLGGEQSGHVVRFSASPTGDGILTALGILGVLVETGAELSDLASCVTKYPQLLSNVRVAEKLPVNAVPAFAEAVERVTASLGKSGRLVIRYSGTEPLLRIMLEGDDQDRIGRYAEELVSTALRVLPGAQRVESH